MTALYSNGTTEGTVALTPELSALLRQRADQLTPAKREGFESGAALVIHLIAEMGLEAVLGQEVRRLIGGLQNERRAAESVLKQLKGVEAAPQSLDERGQQLANFTTTILSTFVAQAKAARQITSTGGSFRESDVSSAEMTQIIRATSYIVWSYANEGCGAPPADFDGPKEDSHE